MYHVCSGRHRESLQQDSSQHKSWMYPCVAGRLSGSRLSGGCAVLLAIVVLLSDVGVLQAQSRGFENAFSESRIVDSVLGQWQAIQNELRATVGKQRRPEYTLKLLMRDEQPIELASLPQHVVVVLGGLQGSTQSAERFAAALQTAVRHPADTQLAVFGYPNDGSIAESGEVLRELLCDMAAKSPDTKVSIVAHSMGGLVARYAIEPTEANANPLAACVDQLVMICPPNHGSVLAQYADALEFPDALAKLRTGNETLGAVLTSLIDDGLGEACEELAPDCKFLCDLNARPRAPGVRYSILAGTGGPITPLVRLAGSIAFQETRGRTRVESLPNVNDVLTRADELLMSDEFASGSGDGAVSVASARLNGVDDFALVPIHHGQWAQVDLEPLLNW